MNNEAKVKLGLYALDQIAKWTEMYMKSKGNDSMTEAEADVLIAETQATAIATGKAWDASRGR